jgi:hypothetical protein
MRAVVAAALSFMLMCPVIINKAADHTHKISLGRINISVVAAATGRRINTNFMLSP